MMYSAYEKNSQMSAKLACVLRYYAGQKPFNTGKNYLNYIKIYVETEAKFACVHEAHVRHFKITEVMTGVAAVFRKHCFG